MHLATAFATTGLSSSTPYFHGTFMDMVYNAGPVAKGVLILLLFFSITSWAIILFKFMELSAVRRDTSRFLDIFEGGGNLSNIYASGKFLKKSPATMVFLAAYSDLVNVVKTRSHGAGEDMGPSGEDRLSARELTEINRVIQNAVSREISRLERRLSFLATTGSTAPFIGLFGTVWGVMDSFRAIGLKGAASIGGVAPGISEALIATAAGLFAAVPAVVAFNYFNSKVRRVAASTEEFGLDFMNMLERKFGE